jgi:hypothetical protein
MKKALKERIESLEVDWRGHLDKPLWCIYGATEKAKRRLDKGSYLLCEVKTRLTASLVPKIDNDDYPNGLFGGKFDPKPEDIEPPSDMPSGA